MTTQKIKAFLVCPTHLACHEGGTPPERGEVGGHTKKAPEPEGPRETARALATHGGEEINERTLHQWQSVYEAIQPRAVWLRLMKEGE